VAGVTASIPLFQGGARRAGAPGAGREGATMEQEIGTERQVIATVRGLVVLAGGQGSDRAEPDGGGRRGAQP
jgi:hypothetical protein